MNRDRIYLGIVTAMIIMVIIYASYGLLNGGKEELHYSVSVVIDNSGSDQWNAFKEGLNQGANESGIYLNIVSASALLQQNRRMVLRHNLRFRKSIWV